MGGVVGGGEVLLEGGNEGNTFDVVDGAAPTQRFLPCEQRYRNRKVHLPMSQSNQRRGNLFANHIYGYAMFLRKVTLS